MRVFLASRANATYGLWDKSRSLPVRVGFFFLGGFEARLGDFMPAFHLLPVDSTAETHKGEVSSCCYSPDGRHVLSGGWDGYLRLWDSSTGAVASTLRVGPKPVSACALTPDGTQWLAGNLDGMLSRWDPVMQKSVSTFLAHPRPVSAILFGPLGHMVTASWDCTLMVWGVGGERDARGLRGHDDIVSGCQFTADGKMLLSWSYDGTVRLWDVERATALTKFDGHTDRVLAGAISADGNWAASGARDGHLFLWDLERGAEAGAVILDGEVRGCFFLPGGEMLATVEVNGRIRLHSVPDLDTSTELETDVPVESCDIAPTGSQIALGTNNGHVRLVAVEGFESVPLVVTATQSSRTTTTKLQRLFGRQRVSQVYTCTCPACRQQVEMATPKSNQPEPCPCCGRPLRVGNVIAHQAVPS
jgi:WD40 repeat protein